MSTVDYRPFRSTILMNCAIEFSRLSTCPRKQVGAIFAKDNRIVSTGYNGAPAGMPHCDHTCNCTGHPSLHPQGNILSSGPVVHAPGCLKTSACTTAIHAEANAIADAARRGVSLSGSILYVTMAPCLPCAQLLVSVGITELFYIEKYRNTAGLEFVTKAGVNISEVDVVYR